MTNSNQHQAPESSKANVIKFKKRYGKNDQWTNVELEEEAFKDEVVYLTRHGWQVLIDDESNSEEE
jgi:hypothetical protein